MLTDALVRRDRRPPPPGRFISVDGLHLHVEERGAGEPGLVLLHGYLASSAIWSAVLDELGRTCKTVAVDLPGSGYSERPHAQYTIPWFADRMPALFAALGLVRPVLGGHSLGGAVALTAAARTPEVIAGLVLVSPFVFAPAPPPGLRLARMLPGPMRLFFRSPLGRVLMTGMVRRSVYSTDKGHALARASGQRLLRHLDAPGGWEAATRIGLAAHAHCPDAGLLARVAQPTLVCWGELDRAHPVALAERLQAGLAGPSRLALFPDAAHNCHEENPVRFASEVSAFVREILRDPDTRLGP